MSQTITRPFGSGTTAGQARPPAHLSRGAKRWWRAVVEGYELEPHHLEILTAAAEAWDLERGGPPHHRRAGIVITGQARVPMMHPAVQVEDTAAVRMAHLIRELGLDATPPQDVRLP